MKATITTDAGTTTSTRVVSFTATSNFMEYARSTESPGRYMVIKYVDEKGKSHIVLASQVTIV